MVNVPKSLMNLGQRLSFVAALAGGPVTTAACLTGCHLGSELDEIRFRERVELEGTPKVGRVTHYRQVHVSSFERQEPAFEWAVARYQFEILKSFERERFLHVFAEGQTQGVGPGEFARLDPEAVGDARRVFRRIDERPTDEQLNFLFSAVAGAGTVYALLHDDVTLHPGEDPETMERIKAIAKRYDNRVGVAAADAEFARLIRPVREEFLTRQVMSFLREHPGERCAILYGASHEFSDDFGAQGAPPALRSVWWLTPDTLSFFPQKMGGEPTLETIARRQYLRTINRSLNVGLALLGGTALLGGAYFLLRRRRVKGDNPPVKP
jgi:hypothetical protein